MLALTVFLPMASAVAGYVMFRKKETADWAFSLSVSSAEFALCLVLALSGRASYGALPVCDRGLFFTYDGFRSIYCIVISFMWMMTSAFSLDYFREEEAGAGYWFFNLFTLGAIMGVFLSGDLFTALVFFEIMSFTSFPWVIHEETDGAVRAACTYLAIAVIGGLAALMGLFLIQNSLGTLALDELYEAASACADRRVLYTAGALITVGFGAKAGMFPLHIWLPKAHPVAPSPASALLSGVLTKAGIWGIIAISANIFRNDPSWGIAISVLGAVTMFLGAVMALFSVNLKKTLACSSMSQIGFILTGIGMMCILGEENALAARGTLLHMVNHSMFKLVLFMCAGAVLMDAGSLKLSEIRGWGKNKPFIKTCFLLAAAGIAGIPGLNGYVSKTLLHESIAEAAHFMPALKITEWVFLISGGLTLAYMTKLFICIFVSDPASEKYKEKKKYMGPLSRAAIGVPAAFFPVMGLCSSATMDRIADIGTGFLHGGMLEEEINYFSFGNLKGGMISIAAGILIYLFIVRRFMIGNGQYPDLWPQWLDLEDRVYRPLLLKVLPSFLGGFAALFGENRISSRIWGLTLKASSAAAATFGENRVSAPAYRAVLKGSSCAASLAGDNVLTAFLYRASVRVAGILSHALSDMTDAFVFVMRRTVYRDNLLPVTDSVYGSMPYRVGAFIDRRRIREGKEEEGSSGYARLLTRTWHTVIHTWHGLTDSLSFALLMLCFTVCMVFIYVLMIR